MIAHIFIRKYDNNYKIYYNLSIDIEIKKKKKKKKKKREKVKKYYCIYYILKNINKKY